jgi:hypothetical protein
MLPKFGGEPLPPSPDCLPADHVTARAYLAVLERALARSGWSASQKIRIKDRYRKWLLRAEGRDPQYEQYGTFPRSLGTSRPTSVDLVVARWRRRFPRASKVERDHRAGTAGLRKVVRIQAEERQAARHNSRARGGPR